MAKGRSFEARLAHVKTLRDLPAGPEKVAQLRASLDDPSNFIIAEAAEIAGASEARELVEPLVQAFTRLLKEPLDSDKMCRGKVAIAEALNELEYPDDAFFRRHVRYQQFERVYGPPEEESAAPVRVACVNGLIRTQAPEAMRCAVDLLCDGNKLARAGAAQALAYAGTEAAYLVLQLKVRLGDHEPDVIAECFTSLLKIQPTEGVPLVGEYLQQAGPVQEAALLALGESRRRAAVELLCTFWRETETPLALAALALSRVAQATDFLIELIATGSRQTAAHAVSALAVYRHDERLRERVAAAVASRRGAALKAHFEQEFCTKG